tara:strand:+ start:1981 stop:2394 length:414 start_codon:yes stop_codon:yes gene_type:complete
MKTNKRVKSATRVKRGRRNRQRGAELQRQTVRMCNDFELESFNRDRGGANHEKGDVEIEGDYYGCKRKKQIPKYIIPEKQEIGVVIRADRMEPMIVISLERYLLMMKLIKSVNDNQFNESQEQEGKELMEEFKDNWK